MASSIGGSGGRRSGSGPAPAPAPGPGLGLGPGSGPGSGSHSAATPPPEPSGDFSEVSCRLLQGGHSKVVRGVAWNCTGELLGTGSADHTVRLWNADTLKMTTSLTGHTDYVESVCWDPTNERVLATTTANGEIRSWDSRMGRVAHKLQPATNEYNIDIKWSPNGYWLTTANKSCGVHMFDARMWKRAKRIKFPYAAINEIGWSPNSEHIFAAFSQQPMMLAGVDFIHFKPAYGPGEKLLSAETQSNRWDGVKSHVGGCTAVAVDPAGRYFATGGVDAIAGLWTLNGAVCIRTVTRCTSAIENMSFSRGSKYLATTDGHTIDVAHLDTLSEGVTLSAPCRRIAWNPKHLMLAGTVEWGKDARLKEPCAKVWTFKE